MSFLMFWTHAKMAFYHKIVLYTWIVYNTARYKGVTNRKTPMAETMDVHCIEGLLVIGWT